MSARCTHSRHEKSTVYVSTQGSTLTKNGKKQFPYEVTLGWCPIRRQWQLCDRGFYDKPSDKAETRKRPHSQPRKKKSSYERYDSEEL